MIDCVDRVVGFGTDFETSAVKFHRRNSSLKIDGATHFAKCQSTHSAICFDRGLDAYTFLAH